MHNFNTFEYRDAVHSAVVNNTATIPRALKQISISFMLFSLDLLGLIQYDLDMLCFKPLLVFFSLLHKRLICIVRRILKRSSFPIRGQPCTETMEANRCLGPRGSDTKTIQKSLSGRLETSWWHYKFFSHLELEKQHEGPNKGKTVPYCSLLRGVLTQIRG